MNAHRSEAVAVAVAVAAVAVVAVVIVVVDACDVNADALVAGLEVSAAVTAALVSGCYAVAQGSVPVVDALDAAAAAAAAVVPDAKEGAAVEKVPATRV